MSVIAKTALFDTLESYIATLSSNDALCGTVGLQNVRGRVEDVKVYRVEMVRGRMTVTPENCKEENIRFRLQFFALPEDETFEALEDALNLSFQMARQAFDALQGSTLGGAVCLTSFFDGEEDNYETGVSNLGAAQYGATYLYGVINE